ncbi:hypothetical protein F5Y10DRAFT_219863 [Nemania abortiva]|nr:hypothetical protein F5Y10DRAFT_219863 [Nemania abortiva]
MSWTQQGAWWSRPLDCHDAMFKSIAAAGKPLGREHWLMAGVIKVTFPSDTANKEQRLRSTWAALRLLHPDVAILLRDSEKCYQPVTSPEILDAWAASTFHVETAAKSADELFSHHLKLTSDTASCHWIVTSNELAIVSSHWRWDGRGLLMMLHEFLSLLAAPYQLGTEAANLVPSIDTVMNMPSPLLPEWSTSANALLAPFMEGPSSIGLPVTTGLLPGDTLRTETVIPSDVTSALRAACRARGIRLTAALHASIITEVARHRTGDAVHYKSWAAFDLRKYCPAPFQGPAHAPSLRMVALPLVVDATADWDSLAKRIQPVYEQSFAPEDGDLMFVRVPYVELATSMLATSSPTTEPNLSNLGALDDYVHTQYGDVTVENVWLGVHMLSPQLYVHAWSWKGSLHISICYNESFYQTTFVEQWLEKLKTTLIMNLGVRLAS